MLTPRLASAVASLLFCVSLATNAEELPVKSEAPQASAEAKPDAKAASEFKPPPGFRTRKRGDVTVYCRKEAVMGTRLAADKCYDEAGLRKLNHTELEQIEVLERIRACGTASCPAG